MTMTSMMMGCLSRGSTERSFVYFSQYSTPKNDGWISECVGVGDVCVCTR